MATFKAEVQAHHRRKDGTYNVKIRVTQNKQKKYIATTFYVTSEQLTSRSLKIKDEQIKEATDSIVKRYRDICNAVGERLSDMTVAQIVDLITNPYPINERFALDFVEFGRGVIQKLIDTGHRGNALAYRSALNALVLFAGREQIDISEINAKLIRAFSEWIATKESNSKRVKGERAQSLYLAGIRALHNRAKVEYNDEDLGIIRVQLSPFAKIKVPKAPLTKKRALTIEQIQQIIDLPYKLRSGCEPEEYCRFNLAKDMFILSFALIGMNSVDLYNCTDYKDGFITYQRTKTKNRRQDKAEITIEVQPQIAPLFEKYRDKSGERVFDFHHHYSTAVGFNSNINKLLKTIGAELKIDDLEFYAARHSWATIALNDVEANKYVVHTALNHIDEAMRVTDIYIKKDFTIINQTNAEVLKKFDFTSFSEKEPIKLSTEASEL